MTERADPNLDRVIEFQIVSPRPSECQRHLGKILRTEADGHGYVVGKLLRGRLPCPPDLYGHVTERNGRWGAGLEWHFGCDPECPLAWVRAALHGRPRS